MKVGSCAIRMALAMSRREADKSACGRLRVEPAIEREATGARANWRDKPQRTKKPRSGNLGFLVRPWGAQFRNSRFKWRGQDLNLRPRGYEPRELPDCSTPRHALPEFLHVGRRFVRVREENVIISAASPVVESRERKKTISAARNLTAQKTVTAHGRRTGEEPVDFASSRKKIISHRWTRMNTDKKGD